MKTARNESGFTLIELLVVIAIIAMLLAILMPSLKMAKEVARRLICGTQMKTFSTAIVLYAQDNDDYLPPVSHAEWAATKLLAPNQFYMIMSVPSYAVSLSPHERIEAARADYQFPNAQYFRNLGHLLRVGTLEEKGDIFYCPSGKEVPFSFKHYGGKDNWPNPNWTYLNGGSQGNATGVRSNYSYMPQHRMKTLPLGGQDWPIMALKLANTDPAKSVFRDLLQDKGKLSHKRGNSTGCNMLYGDGSVSYRRSELLSSVYGVGGGDPLWDALLFRQLLKDLE